MSDVDLNVQNISVGGDVTGWDKIVSAGGDVVGRDKTTLGDISGIEDSAIAIGRGAQTSVTHIHEAPVPIVRNLHQLPAPPRDFTGREAELNELIAQVQQRGITIISLQGMGGIGKTALALKLAEQLAPYYPDAQFYLDLHGAGPNPLTTARVFRTK